MPLTFSVTFRIVPTASSSHDGRSNRAGWWLTFFLSGAGLGAVAVSAGLLIVMVTGGLGCTGAGVDGPADGGLDAAGVAPDAGVDDGLGVLDIAPCSLASRFRRICIQHRSVSL